MSAFHDSDRRVLVARVAVVDNQQQTRWTIGDLLEPSLCQAGYADALAGWDERCSGRGIPVLHRAAVTDFLVNDCFERDVSLAGKPKNFRWAERRRIVGEDNWRRVGWKDESGQFLRDSRDYRLPLAR
jgi:hypothetical protein